MIRSLRVQNFRNHVDGSYQLSPSTTLIVGKNGTGKTSLLEAIHIACRGTSFKGVDSEILRQGSDWYRIDTDDPSFERIVRYQDDESGRKKKTFTIDSKHSYRMPIKYKHPVVLFSPDDLQLLSGSPARRRKYLDTLLAQLHPHYMQSLRRYERALMQRNKLLKSPYCTPDVLFSWNILLSEHGAAITAARRDVIERINSVLTDHYRTIADAPDEIVMSYSHAGHSSQYLLSEYESSYDKDRILGITSIGPHRHDLIVEMYSRYVDDVASRGENRTIILALKSAELGILHTETNEKPLILLDDVYGELDADRQRLVSEVFKGYQTIITSTHSIDSGSIDKVIKLK